MSSQGAATEIGGWSDTPDLADSLRRRKLFTNIQTLQGKVDQPTGPRQLFDRRQAGATRLGQKIHLLDQREATIVAGLEMAVQKFGMRLEVTGTDEQKKQIALVAAKHGMRVEFTDRAMQQAYYQNALQRGRASEREWHSSSLNPSAWNDAKTAARLPST